MVYMNFAQFGFVFHASYYEYCLEDILIKSARHAILISSQNENLAVDVRGEISVSQVQ